MTDKITQTTDWKPIETCPEETVCLVWLPEKHLGSNVHASRRHPNMNTIGSLFDHDIRCKPTHWMELPDAP